MTKSSVTSKRKKSANYAQKMICLTVNYRALAMARWCGVVSNELSTHTS